MAIASSPVAPAAADLPSPFMSGTMELWTGGDAMRRAWSTYAGLTWSPVGKLSEDGIRVRINGGYGEYSYAGRIDGTAQSVYGTAVFADLLFGYQMGLGPLTLKVFAGGAFDDHFLQPFDEANKVNAPVVGGKVALEAWYDLGDVAWAQLDLSAATPFSSYGSRLRLGYKVTPGLSLGLEAGAFGNVANDTGRAGAFLRYAWLDGEISLSGGVSGDLGGPIAMARNPYGSLVYLKKY